MQDLQNLNRLINSRVPLLVIESTEEERVIKLFDTYVSQNGMPLFKWTVVNGLLRVAPGFEPQRFNTQPRDVLEHIRRSNSPAIYVLLDFHPYLNDPLHIRTIREIAKKDRVHLVLVSPSLELPQELVALSARFKLGLPSQSEILETITDVARQWSRQNTGRKVVAHREDVLKLARSMIGLGLSDIKRLARQAIYDDGAITNEDLKIVQKAKYEKFNQEGILSLEWDTMQFVDVGGLERLKRWLKIRKPIFQGKGQAHGLDQPKGVLLMGVQGCGKSLAAKTIAGSWEVPLLRLDFGTLYNKYIGETERNLRESLFTAERMAPCVLWIDELEKGLSGGDGDDGVSRRVLGTLLTWMAEKKQPVFVVATANDVQALPPELLRKGRFDELFFIDLPTPKARAFIFSIQFKKRQLKVEQLDMTSLVSLTDGFSGAEIEQAVISSIYASLSDGVCLHQQHLVNEIRQTRPLSVVMQEKVEALRAWASQRTVPAD